VPNVRGAELALAAGIDELTVTISASATYNQRNVRMSIARSAWASIWLWPPGAKTWPAACATSNS